MANWYKADVLPGLGPAGAQPEAGFGYDADGNADSDSNALKDLKDENATLKRELMEMKRMMEKNKDSNN